MFFESGEKSQCCGCTACLNACPTAAIEMIEDSEGFLYPHINEDVCIHCNLCRKVCCWENPNYSNESNPTTLAVVLKNREELQKSTSGGVFFAIASWVINNNGIVFGAAFDDNLKLRHVGVESLNELYKLRGSKYVQSELGKIYKEIQLQLESDRWCYFTGTGCQVAGLKSFLRKDYPKLITSDVVCHGVPSQKIFNQHISYLEKKYKDKVIDYKFRDTQTGRGGEIVNFSKHCQISNPTYELSPYLYSFMYGLTHRYSCYECKFAKVPRQGDITLADYWGAERFVPQIERSNGVSLVLLNSKKGHRIWNGISNECTCFESSVEDAAVCNGNLIKPSSKPDVRSCIYKKIESDGYSKVARHEFRSPLYLKIKLRLLLGKLPLLRLIFPLH